MSRSPRRKKALQERHEEKPKKKRRRGMSMDYVICFSFSV